MFLLSVQSKYVRRYVNVTLSVCQGCLSRRTSMSRYMTHIPGRKNASFSTRNSLITGHAHLYASCSPIHLKNYLQSPFGGKTTLIVCSLSSKYSTAVLKGLNNRQGIPRRSTAGEQVPTGPNLTLTVSVTLDPTRKCHPHGFAT